MTQHFDYLNISFQETSQLMTEVGQKAYDLAMSYFQKIDSLEVLSKGKQDFVSEADIEVEKLISAEIQEAFGQCYVAGEELGNIENLPQNYWIIDPIDGTRNFLCGLDLWAISIAYIENDQVMLGLVIDAHTGRHYLAIRNHGILINQKPFVKPKQKHDSCLAYLGASRTWDLDKYQKLQASFRTNHWDLNCLGSCALGLAYTALGYYEGFYEYGVSWWDMAAGKLFCEEASLKIIHKIDEGFSKNHHIGAGTQKFYDMLKTCID